MKKLLTIILILCAVAAQAQVLTFTGRDRTGQDYVRLDRVSIFNQTQLWHEVLYYPDTTLQMGLVGIEEQAENGFQLMQNVPNPFDGVTDFALTLPTGEDVSMEIFDVNGKKVASQQFGSLMPGTHLFRATLSAPQTYLLSASTHNGKITIKMINTGDGGDNSIIYLGMANTDGGLSIQLKKGRGTTPYPFNYGDRMKYTGYATIDGTERVSEVIEKYQYSDETINLRFDVARPDVTTITCSNIFASSVTMNGEVTADNNALVTERGFCYRAGSTAPTLADNTIVAGSGLGTYSALATDLQPGTNYRVRAYAQNAVGVSYGQSLSFTTADTLPVVTTTQPFNIAATSFDCGGNVVAANCLGTLYRGVCWNTTGQPIATDDHLACGMGGGVFTTSITGLDCNTTYYVRAYATNSMGTAYGDEIVVTTLEPSIPEVATQAATIYNCLGFVATAEVLNENCAAVTVRGFCYSTSSNPTLSDAHTTNGTGLGSYEDTIVGLEMATTYYVRAYATNDAGTSYGEDLTVTICGLPVVTTANVTAISYTTATCGGNVTADGGTTVTARGVCWSTSQNPTVSDSHTTNGSGTGNFTSSITGLTAGTTYYVRAYATNSTGTAYGAQKSFVPNIDCPASLTDVDGNTYNTVRIGNQCWMKQNLKTTKYADGTSISQGSSTSTTTSYWYYPNNSSSNKATYGLLYNWKAVMRNSSSSATNPSNVQGICPTGWHVPSDAEWTQLTDYVSSQSQYRCNSNTSYIAKALASTTGWGSSTNTCAVGNSPSSNNATGFGAMPAGYYDGSYYDFGGCASYWSATGYDSSGAYFRNLYSDDANVNRGYDGKGNGFSVRCVRDGNTVTIPTVTTSAVSNISQNSATCGGNVTSDGGATVTARGVCWSTSQNPTVSGSHTTDGTGTGSFTSSITGLTAGTTYYVRAYATNSTGTAYGEQMSFTTTASGSFTCGTSTLTDVDGNSYNTVQIGSQCWMKENLKTTKYADGTSISQGSSTSYDVSYWYYPNGSASNKATYGLLYNWKAVMRNSSSSSSNPSNVQGICPTGWHVPSDAEWTQLTDYVSSQSQYRCSSNTTYIAKALASTTGWTSYSGSSTGYTCFPGYNSASNNATGFSALPAGSYYGSYNLFGYYAYFWSATEYDSSLAYYRDLYYGYADVGRNANFKSLGFSVRCVRD